MKKFLCVLLCLICLPVCAEKSGAEKTADFLNSETGQNLFDALFMPSTYDELSGTWMTQRERQKRDERLIQQGVNPNALRLQKRQVEALEGINNSLQLHY